ncbi:MAG: putative metalloprotease CJM1_0395 family protein [Sulfurimonas sp.]|jgi:hypothetical protein
MNIGLSTLYNIGSNYSIKLNEKELLVYEKDDSSKKSEISKQEKKLEKEQEKKRVEKSADKLSPDEERLVKELASRDTEVKVHEAAHQAAGSGMTGTASYSYQQGPDGKMYAIGGEVSISMKSSSNPEETARNAKQIIASAMAAGSPSPQDFAVVSSARIIEMKAIQQQAHKEQDEIMGKESYKNEAGKSSSIKNGNSKEFGGIDIPA